MSVEEITQVVYKCICPLPDCPGKGEPWVSRPGKGIPDRCRWCGRYTWNGHDRRTDRKGKKMIYVDADAADDFEFEDSAAPARPAVSGAPKIGTGSKKPNGHGALGAQPATAAAPKRAKKASKAAIQLPKPKRTRLIDAE